MFLQNNTIDFGSINSTHKLRNIWTRWNETVLQNVLSLIATKQAKSTRIQLPLERIHDINMHRWL